MRILFPIFMIMALGACATVKPDYTNFKEHKPRSILVLPPVNQSVEVKASTTYLSVITRPVAEKGYYVFPVSLVDALFKENGVQTPQDAHDIPAEKLREVFGADAALYVDIEEWGNKFELVQSTTRVRAKVRLVDLRTGSLLWEQTQVGTSASNSNSSGLAGMIVEAALSQVMSEVVDKSRTVAAQSSYQVIHNQNSGFLDGPLKPQKGQKGRVAH